MEWVYVSFFFAATAGFLVGRRGWTLLLAPLPFIVFLSYARADTFCRDADGSDCLDGLGWGILSFLLCVGFAAGVVARLASQVLAPGLLSGLPPAQRQVGNLLLGFVVASGTAGLSLTV